MNNGPVVINENSVAPPDCRKYRVMLAILIALFFLSPINRAWSQDDRAKQIEAARLFIDFLLSKPAQEHLRALRRIPARSDVEPLSPRMEQSKLKIAITPRESGEQYREAIKEFREIFGL